MRNDYRSPCSKPTNRSQWAGRNLTDFEWNHSWQFAHTWVQLSGRSLKGRFGNDLWRDSLELLAKQAVDRHMKDEHQRDVFEEVKPIVREESTNETDCSESTHDAARHLIWRDHKKHDQSTLRRFIGNRCPNMDLALFEEDQESSERRVYTPLFDVM